MRKFGSNTLAGVTLFALCVAAQAEGINFADQGKLLATGGVSQVEGAGGGGLAPWALITGYGTRDSIGANVHYTRVNTNDQSLATYGVAVGVFDRVELSFANQEFKFHEGLLSMKGQTRIRQDIVGVKVKLFGDIVYDQDTWMPQVAIGAMHKKNKGLDIPVLGVTGFSPKNLGAKSDDGTDVYVSATKLYLSESILANVTLRATKANQFGLLGFGGDRHDSYRLQPEASLAYLFTRKLALGVEYRAKPHNLIADNEGAAYDIFLAYFPTRNFSLTLAYVDLGTIGKEIAKSFGASDYGSRQRGGYLSAQVGF
ncbi:MAG: DUF3034 family protein [Betaproteobacteria bacterium]